MAQRFGGKFSPGATAGDLPEVHPYDGKIRSRVGFRVNFLFLLPFPFLISAFRADPLGLALNLACFATLMLAAWLTRDGLRAEDAYNERRISKRPAIPRKLFGSALTGLGLGLAGLADGSLLNAGIFTVLGAVLHSLSFGIDPLKDKGMEEIDRFQSDRVERAVREAEKYLDDMRAAIARAGDRKLEVRVDRFADTVRKMFRTVEEDPRDLTAARKFLGVYLLGARDATVKFADIHARTRDPQARADYAALLDDLDANFAAKTETLLLDNRTDLDVEIEVLRERLARE
ncbi:MULTISPECIES: 5-bromo-4-chloroindolyl phosphate hydrolysis family protein [unclassified Meridianimarinicoccus]|uniref:5-bromo-4-chloroindolyl phosphate hydrolysis family protein n=1 Tax=unclassified Meridianimarinicoccus TaxID=2923344 RepID=UPI0018678374|nr:5-bromo-4-chloroindolyl phosphate hydrolysis family protein [Fluviibacterium sp. MJW13]